MVTLCLWGIVLYNRTVCHRVAWWVDPKQQGDRPGPQSGLATLHTLRKALYKFLYALSSPSPKRLGRGYI